MCAMPTRRVIHRGAARLERELDRRVGNRRAARVAISPYRGFGRGNELLVRGRVIAEKRITRATEAESLWRNLVNSYRRFQSDEVAGARVRATYRDAVVESVTDDEGHFQIRLEPRELAEHALWHEVDLTLPDSDVVAKAHIVLPASADFGVISDIDDTIVRTGATSVLTMVRSVMQNAAARLPFEGVAELYRALHRERNPIFYVSSSPWNLYELLDDFMRINGIPHGPMLLQDWGIDESTLLLASHETHKLEQIQTLVDYYPSMNFVLIGDSGQHDPEIYLRVIQAHPKRILAAVIRDVTDEVRDRGVARILEEARTAGVEMVFVKESGEALREARRLGLVSS
jgi:phosphatidate phosphatase APP1